MKSPLRTFSSLLALMFALGAMQQQAFAADTFTSVGEGIKFARENKRLIVFVLGRSFADETKAVQGLIGEELVLHRSEFAVVHCDQGKATDRQLFSDRFKQDVTKLPIAVVTDAQGNLINAASGEDREIYAEMIQVARIRTGLEKDPEKIAEGGVDSDEMGYINKDGVFAMRKSDVGSQKIALTQVRIWRFKNEATLEAALLEAKDTIGIFRKVDGSTVEVKFDTLSDNDIAFLQQALLSGKAIAP